MAEAAHKSSALRYVLVWVALLALTALTYGLSRIHMGALNLPISLAIAIAKSALVVVFFMHLGQHARANRIVLAVAICFVSLLITFSVLDVATRFEPARPPGMFYSEEPLPP